jgi:hypothetical protein
MIVSFGCRSNFFGSILLAQKFSRGALSGCRAFLDDTPTPVPAHNGIGVAPRGDSFVSVVVIVGRFLGQLLDLHVEVIFVQFGQVVGHFGDELADQRLVAGQCVNRDQCQRAVSPTELNEIVGSLGCMVEPGTPCSMHLLDAVSTVFRIEAGGGG